MSRVSVLRSSSAAVERSWVLVGQALDTGWRVRACRPSRGQPHQVEADWSWALAREEQRGDVFGFLHTHPRGSGAHPSPRDRDTMQAWCSAFGKPLLCLIRCGRQLSAWLFSPGAGDPQALIVCRDPQKRFLIFSSARPTPDND